MVDVRTTSDRPSTLPQTQCAPTHLHALPLLLFSDPSHFSVDRTSITRTDSGRSDDGTPVWSSALISDPFTSGIVSITITILSLYGGTFSVGIENSTNPTPNVNESLGDSVGLSTHGYISIKTPSSFPIQSCHSRLKEFDCIRMEVDLDSTPRTVQFFVNGKAGETLVMDPKSIFTNRQHFSPLPSNANLRKDEETCSSEHRHVKLPFEEIYGLFRAGWMTMAIPKLRSDAYDGNGNYHQIPDLPQKLAFFKYLMRGTSITTGQSFNEVGMPTSHLRQERTRACNQFFRCFISLT
ncbi:hypothetical protein BLNAU_7858 [Blattamonas nauphoetae]|uniref:Uncharacterized protein n=1 Tax=Blattamonas nauphoetae TaxID=2049346 RepID=A0ABQ9Y0R4_9EUKA|nr:hypothetical protein BLNAU_7858 [Blattamonas nauphoetae]